MGFGRAAAISSAVVLAVACGGGGSTATGGTDTAASGSDTMGSVTTSGATGNVTTGAETGEATTGDASSSTTGSPFPPPPAALWARSLGSPDDDYGNEIEVAADGTIRVYVTAEFTIDILGETLTEPAVVQYDADGNLLQFITAGGLGAWVSAADGGLYAGTGLGDDRSITRFDPAGAVVWSVSLQNVDGNAGVSGLGRLADGEVVAGGVFSGSVAGAMGPHVSAGENDGLLARITADGALAWSLSFGGAGFDSVRRLAVDSQDRVIVLGYFQDAINLAGTPLSAPGDGAFLAAFAADGQLEWASTINRYCEEIAIAPDGKILVMFAELGPSSVALFEADGTPASLSIAGLTWGKTIAFDAAGRIYFTGQTLGPPEERAAYLRVFDPVGVLLDERYYASPGLVAIGVAPHPGGAIALSGAFADSADFGSEVLRAVGSRDAFLALLPGVP